MNRITKSLEWIAMPGLSREKIVEELTENCAASIDLGNHLWVANITNKGPLLFCYGLQIGIHNEMGRTFNTWFVKRIPESAAPELYDCPIDIMDMCIMTNMEWRQKNKAAFESRP